jgi:hypothetical protein
MRAAWHKARHELGIELPSPSSLASCC